MITHNDPDLGELIQLPVPVYHFLRDTLAQRRLPVLIHGPLVIRAQDLRRLLGELYDDATVQPRAEGLAQRAQKDKPARLSGGRRRDISEPTGGVA